MQGLVLVELGFQSNKSVFKMVKMDVREGQDKTDVMRLEREVEMLVMTHGSCWSWPSGWDYPPKNLVFQHKQAVPLH